MSLHSLYHILETPEDVHPQLEKNPPWNCWTLHDEWHYLPSLSPLLLHRDNRLYLKGNNCIMKLIFNLFASIPVMKNAVTVTSCCGAEGTEQLKWDMPMPTPLLSVLPTCSPASQVPSEGSCASLPLTPKLFLNPLGSSSCPCLLACQLSHFYPFFSSASSRWIAYNPATWRKNCKFWGKLLLVPFFAPLTWKRDSNKPINI